MQLYLNEIGIPGISRNLQVIVALFLLRVSIIVIQQVRWLLTLRVGRPKTCLYLDERTNRPAMMGI